MPDTSSLPNPERRPRLSRFALEILLILLVKAELLYGIWWAWFSAPEARHMRMPTERVQQHLIQFPPDAVRPIPDPGESGHASH
jgi:hypothetical protein